MVLLTITSFVLYSQIGFYKKIQLNKVIAYMGSVINNDTPILVPVLILKRLQFSATGIDTKWKYNKYYDHERDSFQQISWSGKTQTSY